MTRSLIVLALIAITFAGAASAQQEQRRPAQVAPEIKQMCRQEVRKLCRILLPSKASIQRCVAENRDKLPEQCLTLFDALFDVRQQ